jgi:hypothetical protein
VKRPITVIADFSLWRFLIPWRIIRPSKWADNFFLRSMDGYGDTNETAGRFEKLITLRKGTRNSSSARSLALLQSWLVPLRRFSSFFVRNGVDGKFVADQ